MVCTTRTMKERQHERRLTTGFRTAPRQHAETKTARTGCARPYNQIQAKTMEASFQS